MNEIFLLGNLARDPIVSTTKTGKTLVRMTVAASRVTRGADGQAKELTEYIPVTVWPPLSADAQNYMKGDRVNVQGHIRNYSYEKDGQKHYGYEVTAAFVARAVKTNYKPAPAGQSFSDMGSDDPNEEIPF